MLDKGSRKNIKNRKRDGETGKSYTKCNGITECEVEKVKQT